MIAIGCDHGGYALKCKIAEHLKSRNIKFKDFGIYENNPADYPDIAAPVARSVQSGECELGVLICGTGIGMSLAANKFKGIRAAACSETFSARLTRQHNNSNILCLGARVIGEGTAIDMVDLFLDTGFEGGRHQARIDKIEELEKEQK